MPNGMIGFNEKGLMRAVHTRKIKQSAQAKALGLPDPYKRKKKKKAILPKTQRTGK